MTLIAACHCGHTRIELPAQPTHAKSCNCTYCARTGAVWAYYKPGELTFLSREGEADWASLYNNDGTPKNGEANAMPTERIHAVNLRLIDNLDWDAVTVEAVDGRASW
jgi:hypothetical protein